MGPNGQAEAELGMESVRTIDLIDRATTGQRPHGAESFSSLQELADKDYNDDNFKCDLMFLVYNHLFSANEIVLTNENGKL